MSHLGKVLLALGTVVAAYALYEHFTVRVRVPSDFVGWVLLVPAPAGSRTSYDDASGYYLADRHGRCFVEGDVVTDTRRLRLEQNNQSVDDAAKFLGLTTRYDPRRKLVYRYVQFYLPTPDKRPLPDYGTYWMRESFRLNEQKDSLLESLKRAGRICAVGGPLK